MAERHNEATDGGLLMHAEYIVAIGDEGVMSAALRVRLLGPLQVERDGQPGRPRRPGAAGAPGAAAARRRTARCRSSRLVEDLWGEDAPASASKMIQIYVSMLRKVLPEGVLVTRSPGYALELPPEAMDLVRFEALRERGPGGTRGRLARTRGRAAPGGAGAVARPGARRSSRSRSRRSSRRGSRSCTWPRSRTGSRPSSRSAAHGEPGRRARRARGPPPAPRAAARPADARAVPRRAGRPTRSPGTAGCGTMLARRARHRPVAGAPRAGAPDPAAGPDARGGSRRRAGRGCTRSEPSGRSVRASSAGRARAPRHTYPRRRLRIAAVEGDEAMHEGRLGFSSILPEHRGDTYDPGRGSDRDEELTLELERILPADSGRACSGRSRHAVRLAHWWGAGSGSRSRPSTSTEGGALVPHRDAAA